MRDRKQGKHKLLLVSSAQCTDINQEQQCTKMESTRERLTIRKWTLFMKQANYIHALYRPCSLAEAIEFCTKQTHNRVCVTHPLPVFKTARCSYIFANRNVSAYMHFVQFTYFMKRGH